MGISVGFADHRVADVRVENSFLNVVLFDERVISVPLFWYPHLNNLAADQLSSWQLSEDGYGIRWPDCGLHLTTEDLLCGRAAPKPLPYSEALPIDFQSMNAKIEGVLAYIVSDSAEARYEPNLSSAVRLFPPYGSKIEIIESRLPWIKIRVFSKSAWLENIHISSEVPPERKIKLVEDVDSRLSFKNESMQSCGIEIGARGGVFTRTKSGFRRYY